MASVLITGGTGMIGKALTSMLVSRGYEVIILSRSSKMTDQPPVFYAHWDIKTGAIDTSAIKKADYIIHLAGENVAGKRWNKKRKRQIQESRTQSSALLMHTLRETNNKVKAVISASGIGWYGADTSESLQNGFREEQANDGQFLGQACKLWEDSVQPARALGKRLVILRTGIVLSNEGGAYVEFKRPLKFGIAAILGIGNQVISWIHIEDICRLYLYAIENDLNGVFNAVAPKPVTNKTLTLELAKILRGRFFIPVHIPSFILKIVLGEMSIEILKSATVSCDKVKSTGFQFIYPSIEAALNELKK